MSRGEKALLHLSTLGVTLTGLVYLAMKYFMRSDDPFSVLGHPWQPYVLAAHLLLSPFVLFSLGLIAREHVLERYRTPAARIGRASGIWTIALAAPMILSGYLLQVVTGPGPRRALVVVHVAGGALYALLFVVHLVRATARGGAGAGLPGGPANRSRLVMPPGRGIQFSVRHRTRASEAEPGGRP